MGIQIEREKRELAIKFYLEGLKITEIARMLNCNRTTISKIISRFKESGKISPEKRGGSRRNILTEDHNLSNKNYLDNDATLSLRKIKDNILRDYNINVSIPTIFRAIKNFNYSLKRLELIPDRRNFDSVINNRFVYAQKFYEILAENDGQNIIF
ncbi:Paired box protein Pax-1 [Dictyocoela muelleri]|nr:Paired box protein Pax-1 [Dictyocoela muelleri]